MDTLRAILDPHFLLRNSVYISLLVGLVCPWVGVYLVLRRLIFMGVASGARDYRVSVGSIHAQWAPLGGPAAMTEMRSVVTPSTEMSHTS